MAFRRAAAALARVRTFIIFNINDAESREIRNAITEGNEIRKPGFTRLNFSVLLSNEKVDYIVDSVAQLARDATEFQNHYDVDKSRAIFYPKAAHVVNSAAS